MFTRIRTSVSLCLLALALPWHAAALAQPVGDVAVRFADGETITRAELKTYVGKRLDLRPMASSASGMESVAREAAMAVALAREGKALAVPRGGDAADAPKFDDVYALAVFKKLAPACEAPKDEAAARRYYDQTPAAFTVPPQVRLSRIMFPKGAQVDGQPAVGWMLEKIQAVGAHKITFEQAAKEAEKTYNRDPQGDLGWVAMPPENELMQAIAASSPGDMVGPAPDGNFIYVFRIEAKHPGRLLTWDEARTSAAQRAVQYCREQASKNIGDELFKKYGVQIDKDVIRAMFDSAEAR